MYEKLFNNYGNQYDKEPFTQGTIGESESFDLMTFRGYNITTFTDDDGNEHRLECNER